MLEVLSLPFMQRALIAGILVAILSGYYGAFVVQRGLSFLGSGLAHAAFGGVALGLLIGGEPIVVAAPFTLAIALAITWVREHTELGSDTAIGIFFSIAMALGIVFLSMRDEYSTEAFAYLFGSILSVSSADIWVTAAVLVVSLFTLRIWGRWAYATFDRELAMAYRLPVRRDDYILAAMIAVTVVCAVKVLGIVLITAFLVIPAATARMVSKSFFAMSILAVLIGVSATVIGLFASYHFDVPSGATIILVQSLLFFLSVIFRR